MQKIMKNKGITLVALVVTIIIMLILAGVTLNIALSDNGIFSKARETVEKYKKTQEDEKDLIEQIAQDIETLDIDYNDFVGVYVEGYKSTGKTESAPFKISSDTSGVSADEIKNDQSIENKDAEGNQTFTTDEDMKWRIWDYDKSTRVIRLISEKPTKDKLRLEGATGYNNGAWVINEICRQCYGQYKENGEIKEEICVENLRRSDIQKREKVDYTAKFKETRENKNGNKKYPIIWEKDNQWYISEDRKIWRYLWINVRK